MRKTEKTLTKEPVSGTVVRLASGGPKMTVVGTDSLNYVRCAWFSGDGELRTATFDYPILRLVG